MEKKLKPEIKGELCGPNEIFWPLILLGVGWGSISQKMHPIPESLAKVRRTKLIHFGLEARGLGVGR